MHASRLFCASAFSSVLLAAVACLACHRAEDRRGAGQDPPAADTAAPATPTSVGDPGDPYLTAAPKKAKSIGHTSYVLKLTLEGDVAAAYKPQSTLPLGESRYRGEIAAYRLAHALGLENVPRALPRSFDAQTVEDAFDTRAAAGDFRHKALIEPTGRVRGALIPWVEGYEPVPLEEASWRKRWQPWLTDAKSPPGPADAPLARAISTMLVFDYVTGNWDRWSGGNVARDGAGTLLYVDNDGAFYEHPPAPTLAGQLAFIKRVVRFSRGLVAALHLYDVERLKDVFGEEALGEPLLSEEVVKAVDARRTAVLRIIDARGEAALQFD
jgi:hypothetical protein